MCIASTQPLILFEVFRIENGRSGESVGNCVVRAFDVGNLYPVIGKLNTLSRMVVGQHQEIGETLV